MKGSIGTKMHLASGEKRFKKQKMTSQQQEILAYKIKTALNWKDPVDMVVKKIKITDEYQFEWAISKLSLGGDEEKKKVAYWCMKEQKKKKIKTSPIQSLIAVRTPPILIKNIKKEKNQKNNRRRHEFLLTFFDSSPVYQEREVNGYKLVKYKNNNTGVWDVAIHDKKSFTAYKELGKQKN